MRHLLLIWWMIGVLAVSLVLVEIGSNLLEEASALEAPSVWGLTLHGQGEWLFDVSMALLVFALLDVVLFPKINIVEVIFGTGEWSKTGEDTIRAAVILSYFGILAAVILSIGT